MNGGSTKGTMSFVVPTCHDHLRVDSQDYLIAKQLHLGLPFVGLPVVTQCALCLAPLDGSREALLAHAASHSNLTNTYLHRPIVQQVAAMCNAQGFAARAGGEGRPDRYAHSADVNVSNVGGPGQHVRVDVKCGYEMGNTALAKYGPRTRKYTAAREAKCHEDHAPHAVVAFVITATGQIGEEAEGFIRLVHTLSGGKIAGGIEPTSTIPNCEHYWHRRFRAYVIVGVASILRIITGGGAAEFEAALDRPADFLDRENARLSALVNVLRYVGEYPQPDPEPVSDSDYDSGNDDRVGESLFGGPDPEDEIESEVYVSDSSDSEISGPDSGESPMCRLCEQIAPACLGGISGVCITEGRPTVLNFFGIRRIAGWCCEGYVQAEGSQCIGCGAEVGPPMDGVDVRGYRVRAP
jgi:hypothetical protein